MSFLDKVKREVAVAAAEAMRRHHERESDYVTVPLGNGIYWKLPRYKYERLKLRRRAF